MKYTLGKIKKKVIEKKEQWIEGIKIATESEIKIPLFAGITTGEVGMKDVTKGLSKEFGKQSDKYESKAIRELKDRAERYNNEFWRCF